MFVGGGNRSIRRKPPTCGKLYHILLYWIHLVWAGFDLTTLVVIGTDCIGSNKSNNHMITTTMASPITNYIIILLDCDEIKLWMNTVYLLFSLFSRDESLDLTPARLFSTEASVDLMPLNVFSSALDTHWLATTGSNTIRLIDTKCNNSILNSVTW